MITFKSLSELTIKEMSDLWNNAFEGYYTNIKMPLERFVARTVNEGLSFEHSFACYVGDEAAGIIMNGFRESNGSTIAWNGGTAIVPQFRSQGVGQAMLQNNTEFYDRFGVEAAYLEAISHNQKAIHIYEKAGYELIEKLFVMSCEQMNPIENTGSDRYQIAKGFPADVLTLAFYEPAEVWQAQWQSLKDGASIIVYDQGEAVGFAQYRRTLGVSGVLSGITLARCEAAPDREDGESIMLAALQEIWRSEPDCKRAALNIRAKDHVLVDLLKRMNFETSIEQVLMRRTVVR
ncbi:putative acetyltransferase [compost metagenome]